MSGQITVTTDYPFALTLAFARVFFCATPEQLFLKARELYYNKLALTIGKLSCKMKVDQITTE